MTGVSGKTHKFAVSGCKVCRFYDCSQQWLYIVVTDRLTICAECCRRIKKRVYRLLDILSVCIVTYIL